MIAFIIIHSIYSNDNVEPTYNSQTEKYSIVNLNVRSGPSISYNILKTLKPNEKVSTFDTLVNGFTMILNPDHTGFGWSSVKYLQDSPITKDQLGNIENKNDPLKIGKENLRKYRGQKVPFEKWLEWGYPETLNGTNNTYWVVYLPKANISFISEKVDDKIIYINFGKKMQKCILRTKINHTRLNDDRKFDTVK